MKRLFKKLAKEKAKKERVVMFKIIKNRRRKNEKRTWKEKTRMVEENYCER